MNELDTGFQSQELNQSEIKIRRGWPKGKPRGPRKSKDATLFPNMNRQSDKSSVVHSPPESNGQIKTDSFEPVIKPSPGDTLRNFALHSWEEFLSQYDEAGQEYIKNVIRSILK